MHGQNYIKLCILYFYIYVFLLLYMYFSVYSVSILFYELFFLQICIVHLPPGVKPTAVNKYII